MVGGKNISQNMSGEFFIKENVLEIGFICFDK